MHVHRRPQIVLGGRMIGPGAAGPINAAAPARGRCVCALLLRSGVAPVQHCQTRLLGTEPVCRPIPAPARTRSAGGMHGTAPVCGGRSNRGCLASPSPRARRLCVGAGRPADRTPLVFAAACRRRPAQPRTAAWRDRHRHAAGQRKKQRERRKSAPGRHPGGTLAASWPHPGHRDIRARQNMKSRHPPAVPQK